jgi:monovalent cation/hydrogen antiporter
MHTSLLLLLGLIVVVCLLVLLAQRLRLSYPILLVLAGLALSQLPGLPRLQLEPDVVFLILLPPLLYEAAWNTSWPDFWRWRRLIGSFAFGLVVVTSCVVAGVAAACIPGFTLPLGFLLGGIVSPPDAMAASSVLRQLPVPPRLVAVLEGESLLNDASSLIVFRFALAAVLSGTFAWQQAVGSLVLVTGLGIVAGLAVALGVGTLLRRLPTTPYLMYLAAEAVHASGVMAVVSGGLLLSYRRADILSASSQEHTLGLWATLGLILNGLVFLLIGLQLPVVVEGLGSYSRAAAIGYGLLVTGVLVVTRLAFLLGTSLFTRLISRVVRTNEPSPGWRLPLVGGWAGMRGVVSLASALSVPLLLPDGAAFPQRSLILFITFVVILLTLVVQGLTLPWLIRTVGAEEEERPGSVAPPRHG